MHISKGFSKEMDGNGFCCGSFPDLGFTRPQGLCAEKTTNAKKPFQNQLS
jgi:hypothetical protein